MKAVRVDLGILILCLLSIQSIASAEDVAFRLNFKPAAPHVVYYLAKEKGWFQEAGINLQITPGTGSTDSVKLTAAGQFDLAEAAASSLIVGRTQEIPVKAAAMIYQQSPTMLMVLESSGIKTLKDLLGKRVGVRYQGAVYPEYTALLKKNGIDRSQLKEIQIGIGETPLFVGQVDALSNYVQEAPRFEKQFGKKLNILLFRDYGVNFYATAIITSESTAQKKPEMIKKFVSTVARTWKYVETHQEEAVNALVKVFPEMEKEAVVTELKIFMPLMKNEVTDKNGWGYMVKERWDTDINYFLEQEVIKKKVDAEACYSNAFIGR
jgi:NitT/TauT family transport system substrate-binding protein